jgi:hypothetical protein
VPVRDRAGCWGPQGWSSGVPDVHPLPSLGGVFLGLLNFLCFLCFSVFRMCGHHTSLVVVLVRHRQAGVPAVASSTLDPGEGHRKVISTFSRAGEYKAHKERTIRMTPPIAELIGGCFRCWAY